MTEEALRDLLTQHGFSIANMSYRIIHDGNFFEYSMVIRTTNSKNTAFLSDALRGIDLVREFQISPIGG